jgi:hypothetical protein
MPQQSQSSPTAPLFHLRFRRRFSYCAHYSAKYRILVRFLPSIRRFEVQIWLDFGGFYNLVLVFQGLLHLHLLFLAAPVQLPRRACTPSHSQLLSWARSSSLGLPPSCAREGASQRWNWMRYSDICIAHPKPQACCTCGSARSRKGSAPFCIRFPGVIFWVCEKQVSATQHTGNHGGYAMNRNLHSGHTDIYWLYPYVLDKCYIKMRSEQVTCAALFGLLKTHHHKFTAGASMQKGTLLDFGGFLIWFWCCRVCYISTVVLDGAPVCPSAPARCWIGMVSVWSFLGVVAFGSTALAMF